MSKRALIGARSTTSAVIYFAALVLPAITVAQSRRPLALTNITVVDVLSDAPQRPATVLINNGRISGISSDGKLAIPAGAQVIDGAGKYLIPGLADMHNHLASGLPADPPAMSSEHLATLLNWGITTIFCPGITMQDYREIRSAVAVDQVKYPHFYSAGNAFTAEGGFDPSHGQASLRPKTPGEAREQVRTMKAAGVDAIKMIMDRGTSGGRPAKVLLKPEIYAAIIDEAHKLGLKAVVHVPALDDAKAVLRSGADGLIHAVFSDRVDAEFLQLMKQNNAFYMSTSTLEEDMTGPAAWVARLAEFDDHGVVPASSYAMFRQPEVLEQIRTRLGVHPKEMIGYVRWNIKAVHDAGIPVITGTDTGVTGVIRGISSLMELVLHVEAGLTPRETLRAATYEAQRVLGQEREAGTVEVGKIADLVILDANPLEDIRNIRRVNRVIRGGVAAVVRASGLASGEVRLNANR
jgi:imidazolonepropionase-like amidohydrolase